MASNGSVMCAQCFLRFYTDEDADRHWVQNHASQYSRIFAPEVVRVFAKDTAKAEAEMAARLEREAERAAEAEIAAWRRAHVG